MISGRYKLWLTYSILCLLLIGFTLYQNKIGPYRNSVKAEATVTEILTGGVTAGRRSSVIYYPQFSFNFNGSNYVSSDKAARNENVRVGSRVTVIFLKDNPSEAIVYDFKRYWIPIPDFLIGVLLSLIIPSIAFILRQYLQFRKEWKNKE